MMVQIFDALRSRGTLRRQMVVGLTVAAILAVATAAVFFWQLTVIRNTIQDLRDENERLMLALETAQQASGLVVLVQDRAADSIASYFVSDVTAATGTLQDKRDELNRQLVLFPVGDEMRDQLGAVERSIGEVVTIAQGTIRHAEDENWPAVGFRSALLLENQDEVDYQVGLLTELARERRDVMETRLDGATQRLLVLTIPLTMVVLVIAGIVGFSTLRIITVEVERLSHSAQRLAEGHFDERVVVTRENELGQLADSFNAMARELQGLYANLEQQVEARTTDLVSRSIQLEAAAKVAREAAAIRDVDELLDRTVRMISERFGFYHAGIFLLDDLAEFAVLRAASSEGGQQMVARGHKLKVGEVGIVGYAAGFGEPRIALDVGEDAVYFNNPYLPLTRSEMGLPLTIRGRVVGVLDVQSTQESEFSTDDIALMQTLADQVALAIENARLLEESQQALSELETLYGQQVRESWMEREAGGVAAYQYTGAGVEPLASSVVSEMEPVRSRRPVLLEEERGRRLVAPIHLRGQVLGTVALRQEPGREPWSQDEMRLMEEMAAQIGLALENARLLEESQLRAAREQSTGEIVARMRETLDVDTVLKTAVQEIRETMRLSKVTIRLAPHMLDEP